MRHQFVYRRRVEFADTDVAGIMHFSNFFRFMEVTEHAFYRELGFSVHPFGDSDPTPETLKVGWPRVHASADFRLPLRFEEEVDVELLVEEVRTKIIRYLFRFWKNPDDAETRCLAATGRVTVVCVAIDPETRQMKGVAIPSDVRERIVAAPRDLIGESET